LTKPVCFATTGAARAAGAVQGFIGDLLVVKRNDWLG
jgi:hypothetical protein